MEFESRNYVRRKKGNEGERGRERKNVSTMLDTHFVVYVFIIHNSHHFTSFK